MNPPQVLEERVSKTRVRELFDSISPRYDLFNQVSSLGLDHHWRRVSLRLGGLGPSMKVLDMGVGTGEFALAAARVVGPGGRVYGIDFSERMLRVAREKITATAKKRNLIAPLFVLLGRAEAIPTKSDQFDRLVMAFTLRNVTDPETVFRECLKVLKKGGKLVVLEITRPLMGWLRFLYQFYMSFVVPKIGRWLCGERWPFDYLNQSVMGFETPEEMKRLMTQVGFRNVAVFPLTFGVVHVLLGEK